MNILLLSIASMLPAAALGIYEWRTLSWCYRMWVLQVIVAIITISISRIQVPNHGLFNYYLVLEFLFVFGAPIGYLPQKMKLLFSLSGMTIFMTSWIVSVIINGIGQFASNTLIIATAILTLEYLLLLFKMAFIKGHDNADFIIFFSIFTYYAASIPIYSFIGFLIRHPVNAAFVYHISNGSLCAFRYLALAVGLYYKINPDRFKLYRHGFKSK